MPKTSLLIGFRYITVKGSETQLTAFRKFVKLSILLFAAAVCARAHLDTVQALLSIQNAIQAGDLAAASSLIDQAMQQNPNEGGLFNLRGIVHARRDELPGARRDFEEAVRLAPTLTPSWQNLARACQLEAGKDATAIACAIEAWQHVGRLQPADPEAHRSLALLYEQQNEYNPSLREFAKLPSEQRSQSPNLLIECADYAALGRSVEAGKAALQLGRRADFAEADFAAVQNAFESPKTAAAVVALVEGLDSRQAAGLVSLQKLAIAYEQLSRPRDARKILERLATLDTKNTAHLLELARIADKGGDHEGALGYLAHARDLAPGDAQIHFLFAMIATELDLPIEARESLKRSLAIEPDNATYNYAMGYVILSTRDAATAAGYFENFVRARPAEVKGHYALGIAYFASGDYVKAKSEMQRVENDSKTAGGAAYFLGRIARLEDHFDAAARYLRKSSELMPAFAESHTELGRVRLVEGNISEAQAELERAVQLDPRSFQGNMQLLALYRREHDPRAEQQAEIVKKLDEERSRRAELMLRTVEVRP